MKKEQDQEIECVECGLTFTFTAGEQRYFKSKGLFPPKRCPVCRAKRKATLPTIEDWQDWEVENGN